MQPKRTLKAWYEALIKSRGPYLERAREASRLTVASLYPEQSDGGADELPTRYQSVGAEIVKGLANKMVLALFPPGVPFFRLGLDPRARTELEKLKADGGDPEEIEAAKAEIDSALANQELVIQQAFEGMINRGDLAQGLQYLLVGGPAAFFVPDDGMKKLSLLKLEQLALQRSGDGYRRLVVETFVSVWDLPQEVQKAAKALKGQASTTDSTGHRDGSDDRDEVAVYTGQFKMPSGKFKVWQELGDGTMVGESKMFDEDFAPIIVAPFAQLPNEDYPRSMCEDHLGDLNAVEALTRSVISAAAAAARVLGLVAPESTADPAEINAAPNGSFVTGRESDISMLQANKGADLAAVQAVLDPIISRLRGAFLSNMAAQRKGERVTAEEIRLVAQELESSLGGVYSSLSASLQYPLLVRIMRKLERSREIVPLGKAVRPTIVTGLEALGRQAEASRLTQFLQTASAVLTPPGVLANIKPRGVMRALAAAFGVSTVNSAIFKTEKEAVEEEQQARQQALAQPALEAAAKSAAGEGAKAYVQGQVQPPGAS